MDLIKNVKVKVERLQHLKLDNHDDINEKKKEKGRQVVTPHIFFCGILSTKKIVFFFSPVQKSFRKSFHNVEVHEILLKPEKLEPNLGHLD